MSILPQQEQAKRREDIEAFWLERAQKKESWWFIRFIKKWLVA